VRPLHVRRFQRALLVDDPAELDWGGLQSKGQGAAAEKVINSCVPTNVLSGISGSRHIYPSDQLKLNKLALPKRAPTSEKEEPQSRSESIVLEFLVA
jgi:hypothetical protein